MEIKEVYKVTDPVTGHVLNVHLSEAEHLDVLQAGFFFLMQQGYINFKKFQEEVQAVAVEAAEEEAAAATKQ